MVNVMSCNNYTIGYSNDLTKSTVQIQNQLYSQSNYEVCSWIVIRILLNELRMCGYFIFVGIMITTVFSNECFYCKAGTYSLL